ncbi:hypothetical protein MDA_GLEAN10025269 [Myotis davidii]|uniref:Uncharacterized protein n=1 Tax=Myotis davidii TaxID=225400 RepID=L5LYW6_MYODS|nr:hypothetical protein MDA_GLEAN10025269 [Myotis davidii]
MLLLAFEKLQVGFIQHSSEVAAGASAGHTGQGVETIDESPLTQTHSQDLPYPHGVPPGPRARGLEDRSSALHVVPSLKGSLRINSKWVKYLKVCHETIKILEENIGRKITDILHSNSIETSEGSPFQKLTPVTAGWGVQRPQDAERLGRNERMNETY